MEPNQLPLGRYLRRFLIPSVFIAAMVWFRVKQDLAHGEPLGKILFLNGVPILVFIAIIFGVYAMVNRGGVGASERELRRARMMRIVGMGAAIVAAIGAIVKIIISRN